MYAIISDGPHQYRVEAGQFLDVERKDLPEDATTITFDRVLFVGDDASRKIGQPVVEGATVTATVVGEFKGEKLYIQKYRRRKTYKRRTGHRQRFLRVQIEKING